MNQLGQERPSFSKKMKLTGHLREYSNRMRIAFSPRFGVWAWYALVFVLAPAFFLFGVPFAEAYTRAEGARFQRSIIDYRSWLNPNFPKIKRKETKYIIVHTSESGLQGTL